MTKLLGNIRLLLSEIISYLQIYLNKSELFIHAIKIQVL